MNVGRYFESLSGELDALKSRVRTILADRHWLTDGQWKESILRSVLRRHMPQQVGVGSGFVISREGPTKQIDVLLYDQRKPLLFSDAEMVMITPDACLGIIEVKSNIANIRLLRSAVRALAKNSELIRSGGGAEIEQDLFVGLFSFEYRGLDWEDVFDVLAEEAQGNGNLFDHRHRIVNHISLGPDHFVRFWPDNPTTRLEEPYDEWHGYSLPSRSFGYFVNNAVETASSSPAFDTQLWFPTRGKEMRREARRRLAA